MDLNLDDFKPQISYLLDNENIEWEVSFGNSKSQNSYFGVITRDVFKNIYKKLGEKFKNEEKLESLDIKIDRINERILAIWKKYAQNPKITEYYPLLYSNPVKHQIAFIGLNPSYSPTKLLPIGKREGFFSRNLVIEILLFFCQYLIFPCDSSPKMVIARSTSSLMSAKDDN